MLGPALGEPTFSCHPARSKPRHIASDSLLVSRSSLRRRQAGERPRVMLIVPPYTRLRQPSLPRSAFRDIGLDTFEIMKRAGTPIGLVRIATVARNSGYEIRIVDAPFEGWNQEWVLLETADGTMLRYGLTDDQLRKRIADFDPDIVGIQCNYTVQWGNARALADLVKAMDSTIVIVGGGAHMSGDWCNALLDAPIDLIAINEADRSFTQLLDALTGVAVPADQVRGVAYRKNGKAYNSNVELGHGGKSKYVSINPHKQTLEERKSLMPLPDFGFLDMSNYGQHYHSSGERVRKNGAWAQIFSTVGCNVGCDFCYIPMINGPWRALGIDWFDQHLADLKRHGVTEVLIEDDHLLHDPLYAWEVCNVLEKHDLPWVEEGGLSLFNLIMLHLGAPLLDTLTEAERRSRNYALAIKALNQGMTARSLIKRMAESGCYSVYLAVESANQDSLTNSNKPKINTMRNATAEIVSIFTENGIQVTGGFMLGFVNPSDTPGQAPYIETLEQIERTIDYSVELMQAGMAYANPFIVTPIPGTPMGEFQRQYAVRNYDIGWSHEKATMGTGSWTAEDIEAMRLKLLVNANGKERVMKMVARGTWPVDA
jgi:anaerobic magnesium-protoporphyrin IX monomethyl ester cyclase